MVNKLTPEKIEEAARHFENIQKGKKHLYLKLIQKK